MTEEEYQKKIALFDHKGMSNTSFEHGIEFARKNPPPEVEDLVNALRSISLSIFNPSSMTEAKIMLSSAEKKCDEALADFKKATGGE